MNVTERVLEVSQQPIVTHDTVVNTCYMVDEQGKEIQITTNMVHSLCDQLLKQCRTIKG